MIQASLSCENGKDDFSNSSRLLGARAIQKDQTLRRRSCAASSEDMSLWKPWSRQSSESRPFAPAGTATPTRPASRRLARGGVAEAMLDLGGLRSRQTAVRGSSGAPAVFWQTEGWHWETEVLWVAGVGGGGMFGGSFSRIIWQQL